MISVFPSITVKKTYKWIYAQENVYSLSIQSIIVILFVIAY